ncbi:MAG: nicotinate phosphoribosyltransferase, partial [Parcubacteria group bacterium]|nr:nicotinate phosphoribosyltransferase [Parcubacteria group bacterium]
MVINSLLDTDLYKLTMQQCALHRFSNVKVKYAFKCRNKHVDLAPHLAEIQEEISSLCSLKLSEDELEYLRSLSFISEDFVDFLRTFKLSKKFISVTTKGKELLINIEGPWLHTLLFEVPILAIVNEVYFKHASQKDTVPEGLKRLNEKIALIEREAPSNFVFADFGTRRRFSAEWQDILIRHLKRKLPSFTGTSNVLLAKKYKLTPIGTM